MRRLRVGIVVLAALVTVLAGSAVTPTAAGAQATTPPPTLTLVSQDPWTTLGGSFTMQLQTGGNVDGLDLVLTSHEKITSRSAFEATVSGDSMGPTLRLTDPVPVDEFAPDGQFALRRVSVSLAELGITQSGNGVYPLEVQLRDDTHTVTSFGTHVVVADPSSVPLHPLGVAWVWPLVAAPALRADGSASPDVVAQLQSGGRLARQAASIARASDADVPLTLAPSPETLDSWTTLAATTSDTGLALGLDDIRGSGAVHQVLLGPYVPLDVPALFAGRLGDRLTDELDVGQHELEEFFGVHIDPSAAMPGPLDAPALTALGAAARTRLVVEGDALEPITSRLTPARPARLARGNGADADTVLATNPELEQLLVGDESPALRAAHLLAELAVIAGEQPSLVRGVAFANPDDWDPSNAFVDAVLQGLAGNPLLQPVTVDHLFDGPLATDNDSPDGAPVERTLVPREPNRLPVTAVEYRQGLQDRRAIAALFTENDSRVVRADQALRSVLYRGWENPTGRTQARELLHGVGQSGRDFLAHIRTPDRSTVTLTSSRAQIPLTFRNDADRPVDIHVNLDSDKLVFPDGTDRELTLEPGKNSTVRIAVETRSSGTFPMLMTVTTAGGLPIQTSEVTVRSSFVSGVGVFLTVGAIVFLVVWWAWDIRRRRRRRRLAA